MTEQLARRNVRVSVHQSAGYATEGVYVCRQFGNRKRVRLLAATFPQRVTLAHVNRRSRLKVGQPKVSAPIATVSSTQQREQRLVLVYGQQLPVAKRPALGRKSERHDPDLRKKRFS